MASAWHNMPAEVPLDTEPCFIRLDRWFGPTFLAKWTQELSAWVISDSPLGTIPWYHAPRWRHETEPPG